MDSESEMRLDLPMKLMMGADPPTEPISVEHHDTDELSAPVKEQR